MASQAECESCFHGNVLTFTFIFRCCALVKLTLPDPCAISASLLIRVAFFPPKVFLMSAFLSFKLLVLVLQDITCGTKLLYTNGSCINTQQFFIGV